jgi:hypothetical protein
VLQTAWVMGGALGVLLPPTYWIGFSAVSVLLALGLTQTARTRHRSSRPTHRPTMSRPDMEPYRG